MKKRWKIIVGILCIALVGTACSEKKVNDGEEQQTTINKTGKEENENQSKLDVLRPIAYSNVENLNLEPGSYISIIGRNSGDSYWNEVKAGAERAVADINSMLGYKGDDKIRLNFSGPSESDDVDEQINILDEELARYPIAVGISVVDATACEVQFDLAAENDIPIVAFDSGSEYQGIGRPNRIYVKYPDALPSTDRKLSIRETENCLSERQDLVCQKDRNLSGSKNKKNKYQERNRRDRGNRIPYGPGSDRKYECKEEESL